MSYQHAPHRDCPICQEAFIAKLSKENEALKKAAQLALDWATGAGPYAEGKDTIENLAEEVAPALEAVLKT